MRGQKLRPLRRRGLRKRLSHVLLHRPLLPFDRVHLRSHDHVSSDHGVAFGSDDGRELKEMETLSSRQLGYLVVLLVVITMVQMVSF
jgi:hypothetical protein